MVYSTDLESLRAKALASSNLATSAFSNISPKGDQFENLEVDDANFLFFQSCFSSTFCKARRMNLSTSAFLQILRRDFVSITKEKKSTLRDTCHIK